VICEISITGNQCAHHDALQTSHFPNIGKKEKRNFPARQTVMSELKHSEEGHASMTNNRKSTFARLMLVSALLTGTAVSLSACNTTRGAGQDVSAVGHATSNAATSAQQGIANATGASTH